MMPRFVPLAQEDPMSTLCRMVVNTRYEDFPPSVIHHAKRAILDGMAVTIGGSAMEGIAAVVDFVKSKGGKPESLIPFYGGKVPASEAGMAIGPMSRAMDFGDVHEEAGHCSEYIFPALLAATGLRQKVSGKEFMTAYILSKEVFIRIGSAWRIYISFPMGRGEGHPMFAATAAVGKLLGLSQEEMENAEGIARAMTQPHDVAMFSPATLIMSVHHGFVCQDAINGCLLAQRGITGPRQEVLLGPRGYLTMAAWETNPNAITKDLGEKWEMENTSLKYYSCCGAIPTSIDVLLDQMKTHNFGPDDIASIHIDASPAGWQISVPKEEKWNPRTASECQFSMPYCVATAAYDKRIFLDSYTPQAMARRDVRELMTRISISEDKSLPRDLSARVHTTLKDGRKVHGESFYRKGHPNNPLTDQEIVEKFRKCVPYCAFKISNEKADFLIDAIWNLEKVNDVVNTLLLPVTPQ
jgi:2-methylcitrate dehydratase PrpD